MDGLTLLADASAAGLRVWLDGDNLKLAGPKAAAPIVERLITAKPIIMAALRSQAAAVAFQTLRATLDADDALSLDERAAAIADSLPDGPESIALAEAQAAADWQVRRIESDNDSIPARTFPPVIIRFFDGSLQTIPQDRTPIGWKPPF